MYKQIKRTIYQIHRKQRPRDAINLSPIEDLQEGHRVLDLKTRKVIIRPKVTAIPVTDTVIKAVEALAEIDGVKCFKLLDRNKVNIDHDSFIAGVQEEHDSKCRINNDGRIITIINIIWPL